jgi:hypothetical protein
MRPSEMDMNDNEKELLGFLYDRIGHRANASISMRELQIRFAEIPTATFWMLCDGLIEKLLVNNPDGDLLTLTPEGWKAAHFLQGTPPIRNPRLAPEPTPRLEEHLVWDLSRLADHQRATAFAMRFRQSLCVYSPPVMQLYTNYDILVPKDNERKLTILPNPGADHDTYSFINADAVMTTKLFIAPTPEGDLQLLAPTATGGWKALPLGVGLNLVQNKMGDVAFLPVLTKGDLRELRPAQPVLHLHRIQLDKIRGRSEMETRSILRVIQENLAEHFGFVARKKIVAISA